MSMINHHHNKNDGDNSKLPLIKLNYGIDDNSPWLA